jgi:hypothetical protein
LTKTEKEKVVRLVFIRDKKHLPPGWNKNLASVDEHFNLILEETATDSFWRGLGVDPRLNGRVPDSAAGADAAEFVDELDFLFPNDREFEEYDDGDGFFDGLDEDGNNGHFDEGGDGTFDGLCFD